MHEATIAKSILEIVSKQIAKTPGALRALQVHVVAGQFRNVDRESLEFAFDSLKMLYQRTSGCELHLEMPSAIALCRDSQHAYHPCYQQAYCCPLCGSGIGKLVSGEELDVVNVSLETVLHEEQKDHARVIR